MFLQVVMTPLVMVVFTGVLVAAFELIRVELAPKDFSGDLLNEPSLKLLRVLKLPAEIPVADLVMPSRVSSLQFIFDTAEVASEDLFGDLLEEPGVEIFDDVKIPCCMVLVRAVSVGVIMLGSSVSVNESVVSAWSLLLKMSHTQIYRHWSLRCWQLGRRMRTQRGR